MQKESKCLNCDTEFEYCTHHTFGIYCNRTCAGEHRRKVWFDRNQTLFDTGKLKSRAAFKKFVIKRDGNKCSLCDVGSEWNGKPIVMVIDHIDGNATNNMPDNFRLVCPNCDSQLPTFKARNIGKGRAARGLKPYDRK